VPAAGRAVTNPVDRAAGQVVVRLGSRVELQPVKQAASPSAAAPMAVPARREVRPVRVRAAMAALARHLPERATSPAARAGAVVRPQAARQARAPRVVAVRRQPRVAGAVVSAPRCRAWRKAKPAG
jgi:hypothetical protein